MGVGVTASKGEVMEVAGIGAGACRCMGHSGMILNPRWYWLLIGLGRIKRTVCMPMTHLPPTRHSLC